MLEALLPTIRSTHHEHSKNTYFSQAPLPTQRKLKGMGKKIVVGTVVKAKIGELIVLSVGASQASGCLFVCF